MRPLPVPDAVSPLRTGGPRTARIASYTIEATLDPERHQIAAVSTLTWTNTSTVQVTSLPFHLYLNAFKNEESLFWRSSRGQMRFAEATPGKWGWIRIESVIVAGSAAERAGDLVNRHAPDETVAELPQVVEPGASVTITFKYTAQLPEVWARTGYKGDFHMVAQWFPKIGVLARPGDEKEPWECRPFHANSEFFADFGTYDVTLTVPNTYVVAATGVLASASEGSGGMRTYRYRAEDVHDFAWMADPYMETLIGTAQVEDGPVEVRVLARPEQHDFATRHLDAAVAAVERFSASYLPYPWPILTVIDPPMEASFGAGGMEYPTLVTTGGDTVFARPGVRLPEFVTVHEIGHQWFQGILASNEVLEAWLDEGVNEWADGKVMNELYGPRASGLDWMGWTAEIVALRRALAADPASLPSPIATAAFAFVDNDAYGEATYGSTMRALYTLEQYAGAAKFAAAMKAYVKEWAWKHPTGRDLFDTLTRELGGEDLTWFFGPVWKGVGGMDLGIRTAACRVAHAPRGVFGEGSTLRVVGETEAPDEATFTCEVVVTNTGTLHVPVDIELHFADGSTVTHRWQDRGTGARWYRIVEARSSRLVEVALDPKGEIALDSPMRHRLRLEGDGSASLRAAAWFGATAQTLMQIVGP
ncbi:MAG: M1 family metallopeptidase [Deltaproteobacteria bacterium]|nr:M1 family metallopeptidase [Deltaproteobacteria bacterium]